MAQIVVRRLPDAVHAALRDRARRQGVSAEALARDILARALLPDAAREPGADFLARLSAIWEGADLSGFEVARDGAPPEPPTLEDAP